ncbi:MAG: hypothetical protein GX158_10345 [Bacteroidales bacterium]|nr:hypothetical protein [Bacteroidales bacterium]
MKKLLPLLFFIPLVVQAQSSNTEKIFNSANCLISVMETFANDSLVSAYVIFDAKDDRLPTLKNYFTLCYDTPQNVYKFLTELEMFVADVNASPEHIDRHKVEIDKSAGTRMVRVYDERELIFHRFTPKTITAIKTGLNEWALKHNIKLELHGE